MGKLLLLKLSVLQAAVSQYILFALGEQQVFYGCGSESRSS